MTIYGDLDVSIIDQMPKNRKKVITKITSDKKLPEVYRFIENKAAQKYQTYIVYPLVEESEKLELKAMNPKGQPSGSPSHWKNNL